MFEFIKKNIFIILIFFVTLFVGFFTFLTFIGKSFIQLNDTNLQYLLIANIILLIFFFLYVFIEIKKKKNKSNIMLAVSKYCRLFSLSSIKLLPIKVKNVIKANKSVKIKITIINKFLFNKANIN